MLKRVFDILASFCGLILLSPVIAVVAWQISRKLGSPVLFRQVRPGLNGKPFEMIKFRSMRDAVDANGQPLPDSERMTPFGSFLRSSSLDELPGLWNVLKGEMSLVGPRPLLMEYLPLYSPEQYRRHEARPGVTGWAQINGRNAISWPEKFALDVWYVDNQSFWLDIKIVFLTIKKVFIRDGISAEGEATMSKFVGDPKPQLAILGASGHGKVVADTAELLGYECVFFDDAYPQKQANEAWPIVGTGTELFERLSEFDGVVVAIGNNTVRFGKIQALRGSGARLPSIIHPTAVISQYTEIAEGSVVFAGVVVNAFAKIGVGAILNTGCTVDHDCELGHAVHISPGANLAGGITVADCSWVGIGASVKQLVAIGSNVMIGAGSVVLKHIASDSVVAGNPAKPLTQQLAE